jgi:predicted RNase H-like HicB family nuclease
MKVRGYDIEVRKLSARLGRGFVAFAPALRGCLADGVTAAESVENLKDAVDCWLRVAADKGLSAPPSG